MRLSNLLATLIGVVGFGMAAAGTALAQAEAPPPPPPQIEPAPEQLPPPPPAAPAGAPSPAPEYAPGPETFPDQGAAQAQPDYPIPPNVQGAAIPVQGGGYCFGGPHPAPGGGWEATPSPHVHNYAPFDLRLFSYHNGCYYFTGDPRDFGYTGQSYSYYGAHPIADEYGGGWCFMVGPHSHWWRPWSPYFTVVGPWNYWNGPYDPFFWAYWPFYSFYYRSYYPHYYAGGRYFRGGFRAAPPIMHVPASAGAGWRAAPAVAGGYRGGAPVHGVPGGTYRGGAPVYRGAPAGGGWRAAPVPSAPRGGGGCHGGGGFRSHGR